MGRRASSADRREDLRDNSLDQVDLRSKCSKLPHFASRTNTDSTVSVKVSEKTKLLPKELGFHLTLPHVSKAGDKAVATRA